MGFTEAWDNFLKDNDPKISTAKADKAAQDAAAETEKAKKIIEDLGKVI